MLRLRIVLDFAAIEAAPLAEDQMRGYLEAMVQYQRLGVSLGSRDLEDLGFTGVQLLEAAFEEAPSAGERVGSAGQRAADLRFSPAKIPAATNEGDGRAGTPSATPGTAEGEATMAAPNAAEQDMFPAGRKPRPVAGRAH